MAEGNMCQHRTQERWRQKEKKSGIQSILHRCPKSKGRMLRAYYAPDTSQGGMGLPMTESDISEGLGTAPKGVQGLDIAEPT